MAGDFSVAGLVVALGIIALWVCGFCLGLTLGARRFPPRVVWMTAAILVGGLGIVAFARLFLQPLVSQELGAGYTVFFLAALLGMPSAAAAWIAIKRAKRQPVAHVIVDFVLVIAGFVFVLPIAAIVASIPDIFRLFG